MKRIDPYTGEEFFPKKISQKFACASNRIMFNNQKASKLRQERSFIDRHLHKNHLILKEIYIAGRNNTFNSYWLEGKGYRFDSYNHLVEFEGIMRPAVYEFIIIDMQNDDLVEIIKLKKHKNGRF